MRGFSRRRGMRGSVARPCLARRREKAWDARDDEEERWDAREKALKERWAMLCVWCLWSPAFKHQRHSQPLGRL